MKEKIIEALKKKYASFGFDVKVLESVANYLEPSIPSEDKLDNGVAGVELLLKSFQSNFDKLRTEKSEAEKKLKELEGNKIEPTRGPVVDPIKPTKEDPNAELKKQIADMQAKITQMETSKIVGTRKSQLNEIIKDLPKPMQSAYNRMSLDSLKDEEFTTLQTEIAAEAKAYTDEVAAKGATFGKPFTAAKTEPKTKLSDEDMATLTAGFKV